MRATLAAFAVSAAPLDERVQVAAELARALEALHRRRRVHGALSPATVAVLDGAAVVLAPVAPSGPAQRAGFDAPEVARGGRATRRSDAFSLGALTWLVLTGRPPFAAESVPESIRRVLFEEPPPARLDAPSLPVELDAALARLLEKRPRRRGSPSELVRALEGSRPTPIRAATPMSAHPERSADAGGEDSKGIPTSDAAAAVHPERSADAEASARSRRATPTSGLLSRLLSASPLHQALLVAVPLLALAVAFGFGHGAALARDVAGALERGDLAAARRRLDQAARERPDDPLVEKLRGDLACARGAPGECVRRYRVAIAARPDLREDPTLRGNARALLRSEQSCGTRRAAAKLLGELRDREALPALEAARRAGGIFAPLCTGDSIDRAIAATRAPAR